MCKAREKDKIERETSRFTGLKEGMSFGISYFMEKFTESNITVHAGQTAYFLILSFFPFLMFFLALLKMTSLDEAELVSWIMTIVPESFHEMFESVIHSIYQGSSGGVLSVTMVTALWLFSKTFYYIELGIAAVYETKEKRKGWLGARMGSILYSLLFALLLLVALAILVFGKHIGDFLASQLPSWGNPVLTVFHFRSLIAIVILFFFFWILYIGLSNKKIRWRHQAIGAFFAAAGWVIFSYAFSIYVNHYCNYASVYGTMTTVALLMLWLYGLMFVLFFGGFINSYRHELIKKRRQVRAEES